MEKAGWLALQRGINGFDCSVVSRVLEEGSNWHDCSVGSDVPHTSTVGDSNPARCDFNLVGALFWSNFKLNFINKIRM